MGLIRVRLLYHTELLTAISEKLDTRGPKLLSWLWKLWEISHGYMSYFFNVKIWLGKLWWVINNIPEVHYHYARKIILSQGGFTQKHFGLWLLLLLIHFKRGGGVSQCWSELRIRRFAWNCWKLLKHHCRHQPITSCLLWYISTESVIGWLITPFGIKM